MGEHGDRLDENFGALIKPSASAWEKAKTAFDVAASLSGIPGAALAVKGLCLGRAWLYDEKKPDRVLNVLLGLKERIEKLEAAQNEYLKTEAAHSVFEETLARIGDQPDEGRRETMKRMLGKILEKPRDPTENRLLVRLADELPTPALKLIQAARQTNEPRQLISTKVGLARHAGLAQEEAEFWLNYLVNQGLLDEDQLGSVQHGSYVKVLTPLGLSFEEYCRG
jgi:hypothetical protein